MSAALEEVRTAFDELRIALARNPLLDLRNVKMVLDEILTVIKESGDDASFRTFFVEKTRELCTTHDRRAVQAHIYLIDYCMRVLRWPEVGAELKSLYPAIVDRDVQLEVEGLVIQRFDSEWDGGQCHIEPENSSAWDDIC